MAINCTFHGNRADSDGGAISADVSENCQVLGPALCNCYDLLLLHNITIQINSWG